MAVVALLLCASGVAEARLDPQADLEREFAGRVAEAPVRCIALRQVRGLRIIGTTTVIAKRGSGLTYRNDPPGGCPAQTMSLRIFTGTDALQLCTGDTVTLIDFEQDHVAGGCRIGMWTPYRRPK